MGCWKETIYGGDAPLDWKENIYEFCGVEEYGSLGDKPKPIPKKVLKSKMVEIQEMLDSDREEDDRNIGYLVLGALIMHSGVHINDVLQERIFEAISEDEWAKENPVRKIVMNNYKSLIKDYDPKKPINVENVNLLEESEDAEEDELAKEFEQLFGLMKSRIKKLKKGIDEKSGVKEYDEGFADASQEEIDFLVDFKELMSKQEQLGILMERIESGVSFGGANTGSSGSLTGSGGGDMSGGKDVNPG